MPKTVISDTSALRGNRRGTLLNKINLCAIIGGVNVFKIFDCFYWIKKRMDYLVQRRRKLNYFTNLSK